MDKLPGIYIDSTRPHLFQIFDMVDEGTLKFDTGEFNIPSQLHGLSLDTVGILLNGGLIRIFIVDWHDPKTGQHNQWTNKEDVDILREYVYATNNYAEKCGRNYSLITKCIIRYDSIDKEMMKTFWNDYYTGKLK